MRIAHLTALAPPPPAGHTCGMSTNSVGAISSPPQSMPHMIGVASSQCLTGGIAFTHGLMIKPGVPATSFTNAWPSAPPPPHLTHAATTTPVATNYYVTLGATTRCGTPASAQAKADAERDGWNKAIEVCARLADGTEGTDGTNLGVFIRSLKK